MRWNLRINWDNRRTMRPRQHLARGEHEQDYSGEQDVNVFDFFFAERRERRCATVSAGTVDMVNFLLITIIMSYSLSTQSTEG
ncbi:hypothetical protein GN956_G6647 [Arapaima gigas]